MKTIIANWKMNLGLRASQEMTRAVLKEASTSSVNIVLAPTAVALHHVVRLVSSSRVRCAAQDMSAQEQGAFTGQTSPKVLRELGVSMAILGHSERRQYQGETDEDVHNKLKKALELQLTPVVCVGEPQEIRDKGETQNYLRRQLQVIFDQVEVSEDQEIYLAYEPIWAIGTGNTPSLQSIAEEHQLFRCVLTELIGEATGQVLYGGSVNPENGKEFLAHEAIDGALVGTAAAKKRQLLDVIALASRL